MNNPDKTDGDCQQDEKSKIEDDKEFLKTDNLLKIPKNPKNIVFEYNF